MRSALCFKRSLNSVLNLTSLQRTFASTVVQNVPEQPERVGTFYYEDLEVTIQPSHLRQQKPDSNKLLFGKHFSDHMMEFKWNSNKGWERPQILPLHALQLHPAAKVFHYGQELYEGLKAYRGLDGKIRLFRPQLNIRRMLNSAKRASLPLFAGDEFLKCLMQLIRLDKSWVPDVKMCSLYIRPTFIGTEPALGISPANEALLFVITGPVGAYYSTGIKPVSLLADPKFVRAWPGGTGNMKLGCNYAPTLAIQEIAEKQNLQQVLWLFGENEQITEVGTMNLFMFIQNEDGSKELITAPLSSGLILPGITRQSVLDLANDWNEFKVTERMVTMKELSNWIKKNQLLEMFGCGTACVISPIERIVYKGNELHVPTVTHKAPIFERFMETILSIQYGVTPHPWSVEVNE